VNRLENGFSSASRLATKKFLHSPFLAGGSGIDTTKELFQKPPTAKGGLFIWYKMSIKRSCLYSIGIGVTQLEDGSLVASEPTANGGYLISEEAVTAIIDACIRHNEEYRGVDRNALNRQWIEEENAKYEIEMERLNKEASIEARERKAARRNRVGFVYLASDTIRGFTKIGYSENVRARIHQLKIANPGLEYLTHFGGTYDDEQHLHEHFKQSGKRISSEWFSLDESDLGHIENYFNQKHA